MIGTFVMKELKKKNFNILFVQNVKKTYFIQIDLKYWGKGKSDNKNGHS